jgi:hypothetical protein
MLPYEHHQKAMNYKEYALRHKRAGRDSKARWLIQQAIAHEQTALEGALAHSREPLTISLAMLKAILRSWS